MNKVYRVKASVTSLQLSVTDNQSESIKFKLFNSGESVSFKIISQKGRKYRIETVYGTILKNHFIEISLDLFSIVPDSFTSEDIILIYIYDKESSQLIQSIELPLKVVNTDDSKSPTVSALTSTSIFDSPRIRQRNRASSNEDINTSVAMHTRDTSILSETTVWIMKKSIFIIIFLVCVVVIMLPLKGYPLNEPHPLDNWVIHLARIWPEHLLPNHLIQYLAIMVLGAAMALFVFLC